MNSLIHCVRWRNPVHAFSTSVTKQDPGQAFPHILCFSSSPKYLYINIWCTFLHCFANVKNNNKKPKPPLQQKEDVDYLRTMGTQPQASWSLRTDNVNPCDTILPPTISQSESCAQAVSQTLWPPRPRPASPTWLFKEFSQNPSGNSGFFRSPLVALQ